MVDLSHVPAKAHLEYTTQNLQRAVAAAVKRVVLVTLAFTSAGVLLFFAILLLRNANADNLRTWGDLVSKRPAIHYIIPHGAIEVANLFVVSTAMLAVVAAINIGIAVMPKLKAVAHLDEADIQSRARTIVWNSSLGYASYLAALVSMFSATATWMGGRLPDVWQSATLLTVVALLTTLIAANVSALADDEAQRLMDWQSQKRKQSRLRLSLRRRSEAWAHPWQERSQLNLKTAVGCVFVLVVFYLFNIAIEFFILWTTGTSLDPALKTRQAWETLALHGLAYTLLGSYFVMAIIALNRFGLSSQLRHPPPDNVAPQSSVDDGPPRLRRWGPKVAIVVLDCALVALLVISSANSGNLGPGIVLAIVWVLLPQALCSWAWMKGVGPFGLFLARTIRARSNECDRLEAQIAKTEQTVVPPSTQAGPARRNDEARPFR